MAVMGMGGIAERVAPLLRRLLAAVALVVAAICFVPLARASLLVTNATFLTMKPERPRRSSATCLSATTAGSPRSRPARRLLE